MKHVFFILLLVITGGLSKAQAPVTCNITFGNGLACNQTVDIDWYFVDNSPPCGGGSATGVTSGATIPISCGTCSPLNDFVIRITAMNGCPVTPPYVLQWSNITTTGGQTQVYLNNCPCPPIPPPTVCCDNGSWFTLNDQGISGAN